MPWDKESEKYWSEMLLEAEEPLALIKAIVDDRDDRDQGNILKCFADTLKEGSEKGWDSGTEQGRRFGALRSQLDQDRRPEMSKLSNACYVGEWNGYFKEATAADAMRAFENAYVELEQRGIELDVAFNFKRMMQEGVVKDDNGKVRAALEVFTSAHGLEASMSSDDLPDPFEGGSADADEPASPEPRADNRGVGGGVDRSEPRADRDVRGGDQSELEDDAVDNVSFVHPSQQLKEPRGKGGGPDDSSVGAGDDEGDPITKAIREKVLAEQRVVIATALVDKYSVDLGVLDTPEKYREFCLNQDNAAKLEAVFKDPAVKAELDTKTLAGQQYVMKEFSNPKKDPHFSKIEWNDKYEGPIQNNVVSRLQVVKDEEGTEIYKLSESTTTFAPPQKVKDSQDKDVLITKSRLIDMPKGDGSDLDGATLHLSLVLKDQDGKAPPKSKAVYFTAHYEHGQLVEMSSPKPVKFAGNGPEAIGYIEHGGKIYTIPVTKEKYDSMMRTIAQNKGQSEAVNLSQNMDGSMREGRDVDGQGQGHGVGKKGAAPLEHQEAEVSSGPPPPSGPESSLLLQSGLGLDSSQEVPQEIPLEVEPLPSLTLLRPSASTSMSSSKVDDLAALETALRETADQHKFPNGDLSKFLDRLMVNDDQTVTLKPASAESGEEVVIKSEVVQEFLSGKRKEGLVNSPTLNRKFSEMETEVGKSVRGEELSLGSPVSSLSSVSSMRHSLSSQGSSVHSISSPPLTPSTQHKGSNNKGQGGGSSFSHS